MRRRVLWTLTILMLLMASELRPAPGERLGSPVLEELRNQIGVRKKRNGPLPFRYGRRPNQKSCFRISSIKNRPVMEPERQQKAGPRVPKICHALVSPASDEPVNLIDPAANERRRPHQDCLVRDALLVE